MFGQLSHQFPSLVAAETFYCQRVSDRPRSPLTSLSQRVRLNISMGVPANNQPPPPVLQQQSVAGISNVVDVCEKTVLDPVEQLNALSQLFSVVVERKYNVAPIPVDLRLAAEGMQNLRVSGRSNTIYLLTKALGTKRVQWV